ncbi:cathepsin O-like [Athalia rosae]|uniref:cathepsin O-like n=1 Tax=Athalia rosae TaxID=37344 RepID=UPI002033CCA6|nr:cathepsin O-like [Athalia rosae]
MEWKTLIGVIGIVSLCFLAIPIKIESPTEIQDLKLFEEYVANFNKSYRHNPAEYHARFEKFQKSLRHIEQMNLLRTSKESAKYGVTEFSDMSEQEFADFHLRPDISQRGLSHLIHVHHHIHRNDHRDEDMNMHDHLANRVKRSTVKIPDKFDWRSKGFVTPVRSQRNCGACWAFSTVEVAETMFAIRNNGTLKSLSVQEMIDCAGHGNFGCNGGDICSLLMWLTTNKVKIQFESAYPMTWKTDTCKVTGKESSSGELISGVQVTEFTCDNFVDAEDVLMETLANHGPVAAAVNALSWQNYLGGIIQYHCDGDFRSLNHAVEIVGYDKTGVVPFYIVRNSWGPHFGDNGYLYVAANGNLCGIANQVSSLNVA